MVLGIIIERIQASLKENRKIAKSQNLGFIVGKKKKTQDNGPRKTIYRPEKK